MYVNSKKVTTVLGVCAALIVPALVIAQQQQVALYTAGERLDPVKLNQLVTATNAQTAGDTAFIGTLSGITSGANVTATITARGDGTIMCVPAGSGVPRVTHSLQTLVGGVLNTVARGFGGTSTSIGVRNRQVITLNHSNAADETPNTSCFWTSIRGNAPAPTFALN